ncbi:hypothetical protein LAC81_07755 [Ensifer adhaerens]|uniref:hypothetical protein n=1 Tax=Ensifer adhaerens TaxID=106592 RepID=UPI001CC077A2|nr:hypothetical protein [Ensifer adhaerens]MBZ7921675.1 hypothetical protein [Ensifer adhaerens]UAX94089.1 hypothetical protein LAC78_07750 [Ensifer adhaerens]UAY01723.1 hypothetical protein LAC80_07755 [Ensifer adhaerens]UAY09107.1 hypothetical protein LAC81_07755 [Ensifer adhaerens]
MARALNMEIPYRSDLKLVRLKSEWQICFQAKGKLDGRPIIAWLRNSDGEFFCEVGKEHQIEDMPDIDRPNFFGDKFHHAIDETDDAGKRTRSLAGADNIRAARAAFDALVPQYSNRRLILREGARIVLVAKNGKIEP